MLRVYSIVLLIIIIFIKIIFHFQLLVAPNLILFPSMVLSGVLSRRRCKQRLKSFHLLNLGEVEVAKTVDSFKFVTLPHLEARKIFSLVNQIRKLRSFAQARRRFRRDF